MTLRALSAAITCRVPEHYGSPGHDKGFRAEARKP